MRETKICGRQICVAVLVSLVGILGPIGVSRPVSAQEANDPVLSPALREIADRRPIRVGWPRGPQSLVAQTDGDRVVGGWGYDLWTLMAVRGGFEVEHVLFDSLADEVAALKEGRIDLAGALGPRPDLVTFAAPTTPLAWDRLAFLADPTRAEGLPADLAGRRVAAAAGSPLEEILRERFPKADIVTTGTVEDGLAAVESGQLESFLVALSLAGNLVRSQELVIAASPSESLPRLELSAWAPRGSPYLQIAEASRRALPDAALSGVTLRWTGFDLGPPPTPHDLSGPVLIALVVALGALLLVGGVALLLRRRVRSATARLQAANESLEARVMLRTAELHLLNSSLARFARSIAHDLRNPITVIAGMTSLLRSRELDVDARAKILESIERSTLKLDEMISTMLTDAAQSGTDVVRLDGGAYEAWLRGAVAAEVLACGADLQVKAPPGQIDVDVALLLKASLNLVGNALKYAVNPEGMRIEVGLVAAGASWILTVDDNGPGLGGATGVEGLFERGVRGHDDDRGQGWGLADVRDLLREAGGSMSAGASPLGGAHSSVTLPRAGRSAGQPNDTAPGDEVGSAL